MTCDVCLDSGITPDLSLCGEHGDGIEWLQMCWLERHDLIVLFAPDVDLWHVHQVDRGAPHRLGDGRTFNDLRSAVLVLLGSPHSRSSLAAATDTPLPPPAAVSVAAVPDLDPYDELSALVGHPIAVGLSVVELHRRANQLVAALQRAHLSDLSRASWQRQLTGCASYKQLTRNTSPLRSHELTRQFVADLRTAAGDLLLNQKAHSA